MAKTKRKHRIIAGAEQAVEFARGDCDHQWLYKRSKVKPLTMMRHCRKCGMRVTEYGRHSR